MNVSKKGIHPKNRTSGLQTLFGTADRDPWRSAGNKYGLLREDTHKGESVRVSITTDMIRAQAAQLVQNIQNR